MLTGTRTATHGTPLQAVEVIAPPTFTAADGRQRPVTRAQRGDVGLMVGWDGEDFLVLLDHRAEHINGGCLRVIHEPSRVQMYRDVEFLEAGDEDAAFRAYWRHLERLLSRAKHAGKVCAGCRKIKGLDAFAYHAKNRDGYRAICRACEAERR